jgi:tetratricopeptide (TPR) repeat protein
LLKEAVEIRRAVFGPDHIRLATPLELLAHTQMSLTNLTAAEASAREALRIRQSLDADGADTVNSMVVLARVVQRQGRLDDAEPLARQALDIRLRVLGENNKLTAQSMEILGELLLKQKKFDECRDILLHAVAVRKKVQGERHVFVSNGLRTLGQLSVATADYEGAVNYYAQAESLLAEAFEVDHAVLVAIRLALASNQAKVKRLDDSAKFYRLALTGLRKRNGETGEGVADCLTALATVLRASGDNQGADEALAEAARAKPASAPREGGG